MKQTKLLFDTRQEARDYIKNFQNDTVMPIQLEIIDKGIIWEHKWSNSKLEVPVKTNLEIDQKLWGKLPRWEVLSTGLQHVKTNLVVKKCFGTRKEAREFIKQDKSGTANYRILDLGVGDYLRWCVEEEYQDNQNLFDQIALKVKQFFRGK